MEELMQDLVNVNVVLPDDLTAVHRSLAEIYLSSAETGGPITDYRANAAGKLSYLTQEFRHLGIIPYSKRMQEASLDFDGLIRATYELVQMYHQKVHEHNELADSQTRTAADFSNLQLNHTRIKSTLEQKERMIAVQQENERDLRRDNNTLACTIKSGKDDIRRLNCVIRSREAQYLNDTRKRETQLAKVMDKLAMFLTERNCIRRPGADIMKPISRKDGSRGKWNTVTTFAKSEEDMHKTLINTYQQRCCTLTEENNLIRETLLQFSKKLEQLCQLADIFVASSNSNARDGSVPVFSERNVADDKLLVDNLREVPFDDLNILLNTAVQAQLNKLETFINQLPSYNGGVD